MRITQLFIVLFIWSGFATTYAQEKQLQSNYDYVAAFNPVFYTQNGTTYRTADGRPGPEYWQNSVNYTIKATLDDQHNTIQGEVKIAYTNQSPNELDFIWLQLDQNLFNQSSRGNAVLPISESRYGTKEETFNGGYQIQSVTLGNGQSATYRITDTRMQVSLPQSITAKGGTETITISYRYTIPKYGSDRTGIQETKQGAIYAIAQWYPRVAVYDDILGWNNDPYTGPGEFYCEYGNFDIEITAPANHMVVCGGELLNPKDVYTDIQLERWKKAHQSDKTVMIRSAAEVGQKSSRPTGRTHLTWKFHLDNARDIAWASSASFIIDAARMNLADAQKALAISAYPAESAGENAWSRSTEYTKAAVEIYSHKWYNYPYPVAVNVASNVGGMEYPAISFCSFKSKRDDLWGVTNHEFGHNWFPMIVGSNERLHGWMDEGFNTFINDLATLEFNKGEYAASTMLDRRMLAVMTNPDFEPIMTTPQAMIEMNIGFLVYYKPAYALHILRDHILGAERFDDAFKTYIHRWAYKHPTPDDFFRTMENVAGENLNWFWRSWFLHNWQFDQAISEVRYVGNDPSKGAILSVDNLEQMPLPVYIKVTYASGQSERVTLPVNVWERNRRWSFKIPSQERIVEVQLDPDGYFPDLDRGNNVWKP